MELCSKCADKSCTGYDSRITECEDFKAETNADRIRNMTDEELAEWIETIANCDSCQNSWSLGKCRGGDGTSHAACRLKWLGWLKKEAE